MSMYKAVNATCGDTDCTNNENRVETLVCSGCGHCAECKLHDDCTGSQVLVSPQVTTCGDVACMNNVNRLAVLVCSACGHCCDCAIHGH